MKLCNLVLHCGGASVDRAAVKSVPTPIATRTWSPIPHLRLVEQVERALRGSHLEIVNQAHALSHGGDRYFGLIQVEARRSQSEYALVLGLRNSHDKRFPAGLVAGAQVFGASMGRCSCRAFCWENFRFSANRSNRLNRNTETSETDGKGSWFPLLPKSQKATWDDRCEDKEKPVLLDPVEPRDVRLIDVGADGRIIPSQFARSALAIHRVERSCEILGLNLPDIKAARLAVLRDMELLAAQLGELFELVDGNPSGETAESDQLSRLCEMIASKAADERPYARTAQAFIARSEYAQLLTG